MGVPRVLRPGGRPRRPALRHGGLQRLGQGAGLLVPARRAAAAPLADGRARVAGAGLVPGHEVAAHPRHAAVPPEHDGAGDAAARPGAAAGPAAAAEREPLST